MTIFSSAEQFVYRTDIGTKHHTGETREKWAKFNYVQESPYEKEKSDYTFAFIGDTQYITYTDFRDGTHKLEEMYEWLANNIEAKNVKHVFGLGDITHDSCRNDPSISAASLLKYRSGEEEWKIAKAAISKLDGKVEYSLVRGNHDDFNFTKYFGTDEYRAMFDGFYHTDSGGTQNSICNSYKLFDVHDDKYLLMTLDFNAYPDTIVWANKVIEQYPDRRVIITVHAYMDSNGTLIKDPADRGSYVFFNGVDGNYIWENLASLHENVYMVVCGHVTAENPVSNFKTGKNGNRVFQLLVDPSTVDVNQGYSGLILFMNVYDGGERISLEWYSPLIGGYKKSSFRNVMLQTPDAPVFSVTFDANGHGTAPETQKITKGEKSTEPAALTKEGYIFEGWYTDKEFNTAWDFANAPVTDDVTLYAKWDSVNGETKPAETTPLTDKPAEKESNNETESGELEILYGNKSGCGGVISHMAFAFILPATVLATVISKKTKKKK